MRQTYLQNSKKTIERVNYKSCHYKTVFSFSRTEWVNIIIRIVGKKHLTIVSLEQMAQIADAGKSDFNQILI